MANREDKPALLAGALIKKLYRRELSRPQSSWERFKEQLRQFGEDFKLFAREKPYSALALQVAVPFFFMLLWIWVAVYYNRYSTYQCNCEMAYSQVGVEIKRRHDLIPNLVLCVSRYSAHEKEIMRHVSDARRAISTPGDIASRMAAAKEMQGMLAKLMAIVEQYPNLKASDPVQSLVKELSNTENRIAEWKGKYNESAMAYNNMRTSLPTNWLGWCFGVPRSIPYLNSEEDMMRAYMVKFDPEVGGS